MNFIKKYGYFIGAFLVMGVLFYSSAQPYGNQTLVPRIAEYLPNEPFKQVLSNIHFQYAGQEISIAANGYAKFIEFFMRKGAHFGTYFILANLWFLGFKGLKKTISRYAPYLAWLLATLYAMLDEFHQNFTADRTPLFQDVLLDSLGALTAVLLLSLLRYFISSRKKQKTLSSFAK